MIWTCFLFKITDCLDYYCRFSEEIIICINHAASILSAFNTFTNVT